MKTIFLGLALLVLAIPASWAKSPTSPMKISGIYSNLAFNDEGEDVLGIELMIVPSKGELVWSVFFQFSEGGAPYTALVPLALNGNQIEFTLPPGDVYGGKHFTGTISSTEVRLTTPGGHVEILRRGKSYWQ